jgi:HK97 family phage major capsid protein
MVGKEQFMSTRALMEKRAKIAKDAQQIIIEKGDAATAEELAQFDTMMAEVNRLETIIQRTEQAEKIANELNQPVGRLEILDRANGDIDVDARQRDAERSKKFYDWLRNGTPGVPTEQREFIHVPKAAATDPNATTTGVGGELIPVGFSNALETARLQFGGMFQAGCTVIRTAAGNQINWPTMNDTSNKGALLAENTQDTVNQLTTSSKRLDAYMYTSKIVLVSLQLLQDSFFDFNSVVGARLGERLGRIQNDQLTTGSGSSQPNGIVTASTAGRTAAASGAISYTDLVELEHSVDPAYRTNGKFMFHDSSLRALKLLLDADNRPLWKPGLTSGDPDTINGYRYVINQSMAPVTASTGKVMLFGDMSKYVIREVLGIQLMRLVERYADYLQVGFIAFMRLDGELIDAGTNPIKHLVMPSP